MDATEYVAETDDDDIKDIVEEEPRIRWEDAGNTGNMYFYMNEKVISQFQILVCVATKTIYVS